MSTQNRFTPAEDAVLREHYSERGAVWIFRAGLLPGRNERSIKARSWYLGLAVSGRVVSRTDGIKTLEDFKARCRISAEDGDDACWVYCGNGSEPVDGVWMAGGRYGDKPAGKGSVLKPALAGWLLSGRKLAPGNCVWHKSVDCHPQCGNPAHAQGGTKRTLMAVIKSRPEYLASDRRSVANTRRNMAMATPSDVVRQAEAMFDSGKTLKEVMAALSLGDTVTRSIMAGTHTFSRGREIALPASSVWQMARAA